MQTKKPILQPRRLQPIALRLREVHCGPSTITLDVPSGGLCTILCRGAAQRQQLFTTLIGLSSPPQGLIRLAGHVMYAGRSDLISLRRSCGVVSEDQGLALLLTGREYIELAASLYGDQANPTNIRLQRLIELFGLVPVLDAPLGQYAPAERLKVSLIAAMVSRPPLYICNRPTGGLTGEDIRLIHDVFLGLVQSSAAVVVLADAQDADEHIFGTAISI